MKSIWFSHQEPLPTVIIWARNYGHQSSTSFSPMYEAFDVDGLSFIPERMNDARRAIELRWNQFSPLLGSITSRHGAVPSLIESISGSENANSSVAWRKLRPRASRILFAFPIGNLSLPIYLLVVLPLFSLFSLSFTLNAFLLCFLCPYDTDFLSAHRAAIYPLFIIFVRYF